MFELWFLFILLFSGNTINIFWQGTLRRWMHVVVVTKFHYSTLLWIWRSAVTTPTSFLWLLWYVLLLTYSYINKFPAGCYWGAVELPVKFWRDSLFCSYTCLFFSFSLCYCCGLEVLSFFSIFIFLYWGYLVILAEWRRQSRDWIRKRRSRKQTERKCMGWHCFVWAVLRIVSSWLEWVSLWWTQERTNVKIRL